MSQEDPADGRSASAHFWRVTVPAATAVIGVVVAITVALYGDGLVCRDGKGLLCPDNTGQQAPGRSSSTAPETPPPTQPPVTGPSETQPPVTQPPPAPPEVPADLVGSWRGGGQQYPYDSFYQEMEVTFTPDGEYEMVIGGVLNEAGRFEVNGPTVVYRPSGGRPYTMRWGVREFAGRPVLNLLSEQGGNYTLDKV